MSNQEHEATKQGVADAFDFWLSQHPVSVPEVIKEAIKEATTEWLNRHGPDLFGPGETP